MISLKLLGGIAVERDGRPLSGPASQRHRLALLALLAAAPGAARSRDKLVGYLWPESDSEHARNLLSQAIHTLRQALGKDAIISVGDELRLNADVIDCDVAAFEHALAARNLEQAVALYSGPFLDGFYLRNAAEFERWLDSKRVQLASAYARALEELAANADARRDPLKAVEWWKARAALDPSDSRVALALMTALATSGNRAGALQHAAKHEQLLWEEFGVSPPPDVIALGERLRNDARSTAPVIASPTESRRDRRAAAPLGSPAPLAPAAGDDVVDLPDGAVSPGGRARNSAIVRYGAALLALAVVAVGVLRMAASPDAPAATRTVGSIAVSSLAPADPGDAALAAGLTEELVAMLAKTGVRVIATTSLASQGGRPLDVRTVAKDLRVDYVLAGAVEQNQSRLRVRLRLLDGHDGATTWAETYDRDMQDVFVVQDDIAQSVALQLGVRLGAGAGRRLRRPPPQNVAAYELYLRGNDPVLLRSDSGTLQRIEFFRRAVALDTNYAAAYAGLAKSYVRARMSDAINLPSAELDALAERAALKALALDDSLAEAHYSYGIVRMMARDYTASEIHLKHAIALDPGAGRNREALAGLYLVTSRPRAALAEAERALELGPLAPSANAEVARALLANGRCREALERLEKIAAVRPPLLRASNIAAQCHGLQGRWQQAVDVLRPQAERDLLTRALFGYMLARAGQREEALRVRADFMESWRNRKRGAAYVGMVYAGLGELDEAFDWLDRGVDDGSLLLTPPNGMVLEPIFRELHRDPRFAHLTGRLGLPARRD